MLYGAFETHCGYSVGAISRMCFSQQSHVTAVIGGERHHALCVGYGFARTVCRREQLSAVFQQLEVVCEACQGGVDGGYGRDGLACGVQEGGYILVCLYVVRVYASACPPRFQCLLITARLCQEPPYLCGVPYVGGVGVPCPAGVTQSLLLVGQYGRYAVRRWGVQRVAVEGCAE